MQRTVLFAFAGCLLLALGVQGDVPGDLITNFPGLQGNLGTQYSGYISVEGGLHFHYTFTVSTGNPKTDPVVLWLNGGPGCSSLDGYFYEQGPYRFTNDNGTVLVENPWTWTKAANVIFLESPVGVGFSYADDGNYTTNDNVTADRNFMFVQEWFKQYPEFMTNDFYVAGESYGGIYVPMLSYRVAISDAYNFKGFMTGNPVTDESSDWDPVNVVLPFWYGHGVIPTSLYKAGMMACAGNNSNSPQCNTIMNQAQNYFNGYNMYNIYGDCITQRVVGPVPYPVQNPYLRAARPSELLRVTPPCLDAYAATTYLNRPDVQKAFHVKVGIQWGICSRLPYTNNRGSVLPEYAAVRAMGMDILTYSGDVDSSVPYTGTARWAAAIGGPLLPNTTEWTQWTFNQPDGPQVGGHVTYYESFTYTTVRGSGHMVPQYRPDAAWNMFISWVTTRKLA